MHKDTKGFQLILLSVCVGLLFGFFSAFYVVEVTSRYYNNIERTWYVEPFSDEAWFQALADASSIEMKKIDWKIYIRDVSVAQALYRKVRLLCWVLTTPENHEIRARHIKATWGKRCNILLFMSSKQDDSLPTVVLPVSEGADKVWGKTKAALRYIYDNYLNKADWFFKVDDDTFAIPENARFLLSRYNTSEPMWFGCRFKPYVDGGYMSGGPGYILSKEAVRRFATTGLNNSTICNTEHDTGEEAVQLGLCLQKLGVKAKDSRDEFGRYRFLPSALEHHVLPGDETKQYWYWNAIYYKSIVGPGCCSDTIIAFHYMDMTHLYVMNYLIYGVRLYGIAPPPYPKGFIAPPPPDEEGTAKPWVGPSREFELQMEAEEALRRSEEEEARKRKEKEDRQKKQKNHTNVKFKRDARWKYIKT